MPGILPQMGADNLNNLKRLAQQIPQGGLGGGGNANLVDEDDDDDDDGELAPCANPPALSSVPLTVRGSWHMHGSQWIWPQ